MISDDIIRQSAHKQMLEALPKQCQLSRFAFLWTYYLYRAFKFVMLITPLLACRMWQRKNTEMTAVLGGESRVKLLLRAAVKALIRGVQRWQERSLSLNQYPSDQVISSLIGNIILRSNIFIRKQFRKPPSVMEVTHFRLDVMEFPAGFSTVLKQETFFIRPLCKVLFWMYYMEATLLETSQKGGRGRLRVCVNIQIEDYCCM